MQLSELSQTISRIYDCALDPSQWQPTLDNLNILFGSAFAAIFLAQNEPFTPLAYFHSTWDAGQLQRLVYEFAQNIPGVLETMTGPIGKPISLLSRLDEEGLGIHRQSRFYREWVAPQGLDDAILTKFCETQNRSGTFQLIGARNWDAKLDDVAQLIELILPHIRRAALISDLIDQNCLRLETMQDTVNMMATPIILARVDGMICYANPSAQHFLATGTSLRDVNGHLSIADLDTRRAFSRALSAATTGDQGIGTYGVGIPLFAGDGYPAVCYMLPVNCTQARSARGEASVALFISSLDHATPAPAAVIATVFGLTSAEARFACELNVDEDIEASAGRMGISANTAKTHLKRIYEKTGASRRTELHNFLTRLSPTAGLRRPA